MAEEKEIGTHNAAVNAAGMEARETLNNFFKNIASQKDDDENLDRFFPNGIGYLHISVQNGEDVSVEIEVADLDYVDEYEEEVDDDDDDEYGYEDLEEFEDEEDEDETEAGEEETHE